MRLRSVTLMLACLSCTAPASRQISSLDDGSGLGTANYTETLALTLENDAFTGSDDSYTNGFAVSWISKEIRQYPEDSLRRRWAEWWSFLPFVGDYGYQSFAAFTFGQEIFTPGDITDPTPPETSQPYAGLLFLDSAFYAKSKRLCHAWTLRLGIVGPSSLAEEVQTEVHEIIGTDEPRGWDTQLPHEPVINLDYNVAYELIGGGSERARNWRIVPIGALSAGTYFTGGGAAVYGEVGWNLPKVIGLVSVRRGIDPFSAVSTGGQKELSFSAYFGGGGFAVGHYLPLDGTVFRSSRSVDSEPLVGFVTAGLALRYKRCSLGFLLTSFTDTFENQDTSEEFGTVTISWSL